MPITSSVAPAARRLNKHDQRAVRTASETSLEFKSGLTPVSPADTPQESSSAGPRLISWLMHTLFALVALLLIADLHSSYVAVSARWETNPFMTVLGQRMGVLGALITIKSVDFMCLAGIYSLWRRSRADAFIAVALSTAAFVYVEIVLNNYSS